MTIRDDDRYICEYNGRCANPWNAWPYVRYVWLLTPVSHMSSIWLVVLVAANRYWAVCRPHAAAGVWTTRRTVVYVGVVVVAVVAFNVPRAFEYRIEAVPLNVTAAGGSDVEEEWTLREVRTPLGVSAPYRYVYKVLFVNILLVLVPLVTLIVLSVFVIRALRQTPSYRLSLLHAKPRLVGPPPPAAADQPATATHLVVSTTHRHDTVVDAEDDDHHHQQQQQQQQQEE